MIKYQIFNLKELFFLFCFIYVNTLFIPINKQPLSLTIFFVKDKTCFINNDKQLTQFDYVINSFHLFSLVLHSLQLLGTCLFTRIQLLIMRDKSLSFFIGNYYFFVIAIRNDKDEFIQAVPNVLHSLKICHFLSAKRGYQQLILQQL